MIFLSASVPDPRRKNEFSGCINVNAIREAIVAFTTVCVECNIPFYFGGHPAISPLVYSIAKNSVQDPNIKIYQSEYFKGQTPPEVKYFKNIIWTKKNELGLQQSVEDMRTQMFSENPKTQCIVFIGGMKGIIDEAKMLKNDFPNALFIPLASTGGATYDLYNQCT